MGEILTVPFSTALYESELEASLEGTCNSGLCLCHAGYVRKVRQQCEWVFVELNGKVYWITVMDSDLQKHGNRDFDRLKENNCH